MRRVQGMAIEAEPSGSSPVCGEAPKLPRHSCSKPVHFAHRFIALPYPNPPPWRARIALGPRRRLQRRASRGRRLLGRPRQQEGVPGDPRSLAPKTRRRRPAARCFDAEALQAEAGAGKDPAARRSGRGRRADRRHRGIFAFAHRGGRALPAASGVARHAAHRDRRRVPRRTHPASSSSVAPPSCSGARGNRSSCCRSGTTPTRPASSAASSLRRIGRAQASTASSPPISAGPTSAPESSSLDRNRARLKFGNRSAGAMPMTRRSGTRRSRR